MNAPLPRRVNYSQAMLTHIKALGNQATQQGRRSAFEHALETIHDHLQTRPLPPSELSNVFGEPCYPLPNFKLLVSVAVVAPVAIHFAVSLEPQQIGPSTFTGVYVMKVDLLS